MVDVSADGVSTRWWIGAEGRLLQEQYSAIGHSGPRRITTKYSEWKSFDGLNYPTKTAVSFSDEKNVQTIIMTGMEINADLDPKLFERP